jgi:hypothetical protein
MNPFRGLDERAMMSVAGKRRTEYATDAPLLEACPSGDGASDSEGKL